MFTRFEVELDVRVFFLCGGVVVWPAFHTIIPLDVSAASLVTWVFSSQVTDTWTLRSAIVAEGVCGEKITDTAASAAMVKATVVKKPKTFCSLTRLECMVSGVQLEPEVDCELWS